MTCPVAALLFLDPSSLVYACQDLLAGCLLHSLICTLSFSFDPAHIRVSFPLLFPLFCNLDSLSSRLCARPRPLRRGIVFSLLLFPAFCYPRPRVYFPTHELPFSTHHPAALLFSSLSAYGGAGFFPRIISRIRLVLLSPFMYVFSQIDPCTLTFGVFPRNSILPSFLDPWSLLGYPRALQFRISFIKLFFLPPPLNFDL